LPLLRSVQGRQTDFILTADGRIIHALAVIYVLRDCPEIEKFQVVQQSASEITVIIVPRAVLRESVRTKIHANLQKLLGTNTQITITTAPTISTSPSGKFRYVISKVAASHLSISEASA
jgi:phenylacetate-CoA ligase